MGYYSMEYHGAEIIIQSSKLPVVKLNSCEQKTEIQWQREIKSSGVALISTRVMPYFMCQA